MRNTKILRDLKQELPSSLPIGELAFANDTEELFVGQGAGQPLKKVNNAELKSLQQNKRDKSVKLTASDLDTSNNAYKIGLNNLSSEVISAMSGNTPVSPTITDKSITTNLLADDSITFNKLKHNTGLILGNNVINVDTKTHTIEVTSSVHVAYKGTHSTMNKQVYSYASNPNPQWLQYVYLDTTTGNLVAYETNVVPSTLHNKIIFLFCFYNKIVTGENRHAVKINGVSTIVHDSESVGYSNLKTNSVVVNHLRNPVVEIFQPNTFEINYQTKKITLIRDLYVEIDGRLDKLIGKDTNLDQSIHFEVDFANHKIYRLYYDKTNAHTTDFPIKFREVSHTGSDDTNVTYTFAYIYQSLVRGNEIAIYTIGTDGNQLVSDTKLKNGSVTEPKIQDNSVSDYKLKTPLGYLLEDSTFNVNTTDKTLEITNGNLGVRGTHVSFKAQTVSYDTENQPASYNRHIYYDMENGDFEVYHTVNLASASMTRKAYIGCMYNGKFFGHNAEVVRIDGAYQFIKNRTSIISEGHLMRDSISKERMIMPSIELFHKNNIVINYQTQKVELTQDLWVISDKGHFNPIKKSNYTPLDFSELNLNSSTQYGVFRLVLDIPLNTTSEGTLKIVPTSEWRQPEGKRRYVICNIYQTNVVGNEWGVKVIDKSGKVVPRKPADMNTNVITRGELWSGKLEVDSKKYTATISGNALLVYGKNYINGVPTSTVDWSQEADPGYMRYIGYHLDQKVLKAYSVNNMPMDGTVVFLCCVYANKLGNYLSPNYMYINGNPVSPPTTTQEVEDSKYNWDANRLVVPNDLYLIQDIEYSLFGQNMCTQQYVDNDHITFEMAMPTKIIQFEQTGCISSPIEGVFNSKITAKHRKSSIGLHKDINIHVKDPKKVSKKDLKILCIGDSITNSNFPSHTKYWLNKFGINATMLGTLNNRYDGYGYGISHTFPYDYAKGEGRGGWRLTDITCTTPLKDGGTYVNSSFPMMNPSTGKFDFSYYMQNQGYTDVDFVIINMGTNDLSGYHYASSVSTNPAYNTVRKVDLNTEYLNPESEFYLGKQYKILIDSIHAYNPNIKIGINPPMTAGIGNLITMSVLWAETTQYSLKDIPNVYMLGSYLGQGILSVATTGDDKGTPVSEINDTRKRSISGDVHVNGMGQLIHSLYPVSWIINML